MNKQKTEENSLAVAFRLLRLFKEQRIWIAVICISSLLGSFASILLAKGIAAVSDAALSGKVTVFYSKIWYIIAAMVIGVIATMITQYVSGRYQNSCMTTLRNHCTKQVVSLNADYMDENRSGDLLSRVTNDMNQIDLFLNFVVITAVSDMIILVTSLIYMFSINWVLTLISSIGVPAFTILVAQVSKKLEKQMTQQQESLGNESDVLEDAFMGLPELKVFRLGNLMFGKYAREVDNTTLKSRQMYKTECSLMPIGTICSALPNFVTMFLGGYFVLSGKMTIGMLIAYLTLIANVTDPLYSMQRRITSFRTCVACIRRIFDIWNYPHEREDGFDFSGVCDKKRSVIAFDSVTFGYSPESKLFDNLSFDIKEGEKIALVGSSGCGKSTVLKLIADFYAPRTGNIRIFGHEIKSWSIPSLRLKIAEVLQDNYLFPDTIGRNIAYGKPDATQEEIDQAAKSAYIYDFIQGLPEKYDTLVGERGVKLSGGQKQRIAIARALLKNAPILLLDEATSALDTESEKEVQAALDRLMADRTTLMIAHRLSTIRNADRILVMDHGRIAESGTHRELLTKSGVYSQLYNKQFGNA